RRNCRRLVRIGDIWCWRRRILVYFDVGTGHCRIINCAGDLGLYYTKESLNLILCGLRCLLTSAVVTVWHGGQKVEKPIPRLTSREKDRKSTRLNSSHVSISYAVFCLKKKNKSQ